jgi:hypothetical protein
MGEAVKGQGVGRHHAGLWARGVPEFQLDHEMDQLVAVAALVHNALPRLQPDQSAPIVAFCNQQAHLMHVLDMLPLTVFTGGTPYE